MTDKLEIFLNNLKEEERAKLIELLRKGTEKPKERKAWKPKNSEVYCHLYGDGVVDADMWKDNGNDELRYVIGNCFPTYEAAKFALEKLKVIAELKRFAEEHNEGKIDWKTRKEKFCIVYEHSVLQGCIVSDYYKYTQGADIYFTSAEIARQAITAIGEERLKKYYFEVED